MVITDQQLVNTPLGWSLRAAAFADPWEACGWTEESQQQRLQKIVEELKPRAADFLLDYGCGTGELVNQIEQDVIYVGFDFAEGMIARARRDHPGRTFQDWEPRFSVDLTVCAGTFNLPMNWSKQMTWATIRRLWDNTDRAMAVSLYAGDDMRCLIYTTAEVVKHLGGLAHNVMVEKWRSNDILAVIRR